MFNTFFFGDPSNGKNVLICGCVHGNEPCGTNAILKIIEEFKDGKLKIKSGSVTFIPVCNPQAKEKNIRFVEQNLARVFYKHQNPITYEQNLATQLCKYVEEADAILDIHSGNADKSKFVFQDYEESEYQLLSNALGFDVVIHGWSKIYDATGEQDLSGYAHHYGIPSVVIECGQHLDPEATQIAYEAILRFLGLHQIIDYTCESVEKIRHIMMQKLYKMEKKGKFVREWKNADSIKLGDIIGIYDDGEEILSDYDGYIVLPKTFANVGDERFYIGTEV